MRGADGDVVAVVLVSDKLLGPFNAADEALLKHFSDLVSKELHRNASLASLRRAQVHSDNLVLASEMLRLPVAQQDAHALMARLYREAVWRCQQLTGAEACVLYEHQPETHTVRLAETVVGGADGADGQTARTARGRAPGGLSSGAPPLPGGADASDAAAAARTFEASRGLVGATLRAARSGGSSTRLRRPRSSTRRWTIRWRWASCARWR